MDNEFTRTVRRMMTPAEARSRANKLGLPPRVIQHIYDDFKSIHRYRDENEWARENEEDGVGDNGRAALGQSWESALEDLAKAMDVDLNDLYSDDATYEKVMRVYDHFYEE